MLTFFVYGYGINIIKIDILYLTLSYNKHKMPMDEYDLGHRRDFDAVINVYNNSNIDEIYF